MSVDEVTDEALRGQPFIAKETTYDTPPETWRRVCDLCFYRYGQDDVLKQNQDCGIVVTPTPHALFGFKEDEHLPEQIDGKEVGNYCPHFLPYTSP
jgi:hypothetical protein